MKVIFFYVSLLLSVMAFEAPKSTPAIAKPKSNNKATATNVLSGDFLTGFETGIFLRSADDQLKEYDCPTA